MPRILEMKEIDGKLAVFLDLPVDGEGSVTLWTEAEKQAALKAEREACAVICEEFDTIGDDGFPVRPEGTVNGAKTIADVIRANT
jgi:hypothetical protein